MELLIIVLAIAGLVALFVAYANRSSPSNDFDITHADAALVNRAAHLSAIEPQVALQLAQRLTGNARQLGLFQMPRALFMQGDQPLALQVLNQLDEHYKPAALNQIIQSLLDNDQPQTALDLLQDLHQPLPSEPLLRIALLLASGEHDTARKLLATFDSSQLDPQSVSEHRQLAALQRSLGLTDKAAASLNQAWSVLLQQPAEHLDAQELEQTLREYSAQGQGSQLEVLAEQLPESAQPIVVSLLMEAGQFEAAFAQLEQHPLPDDYPGYPHLLHLTLEAKRPQLARQLIAQMPESQAGEMLLSLLHWHVGRTELAEAEATLQACATSLPQRIWCLVCLWGGYLEEHPQWSASLLEQALQALEQLRGDEQWPWMRLLLLETQLRMQAALPRLRRDSWLIRNSLEEMSGLNPQLECSERLIKSALQAKLMHDLEQTRQAGELLDQALQLLDESPETAIDAVEKTFLLEHLALSYLHIGDLQKTAALQLRLQQQSAYASSLSQALVLSHIQQQRFEEAIASLKMTHLFIEENPLSQLHQALETLSQSAPEKAQGLRQKLLDRLAADHTWGASNAT